jgi:hypothetical protein
MVDRNELFITTRDNKGDFLDPVYVTCATDSGPECPPERLSKGVYLVSKEAIPISDGCVVWRLQEKTGDPIKEMQQASDGGLYKNG